LHDTELVALRIQLVDQVGGNLDVAAIDVEFACLTSIAVAFSRSRAGPGFVFALLLGLGNIAGVVDQYFSLGLVTILVDGDLFLDFRETVKVGVGEILRG